MQTSGEQDFSLLSLHVCTMNVALFRQLPFPIFDILRKLFQVSITAFWLDFEGPII